VSRSLTLDESLQNQKNVKPLYHVTHAGSLEGSPISNRPLSGGLLHGPVKVRRSGPLLLAGIAIMISGCSTKYTAVPISDQSKSVTYTNGRPIVASAGGYGTVSVAWLGPNPQEDGKRLVFGVKVSNQSSVTANFGPENVIVSDGKGAPVRIWTANDLVSEAENRATGQKAAVVVGAILGVAGAVAASRTTTSGYYTTPRGGMGTFSYTTNDPAVAMAGSAAVVGGATTGMAGIDNARDQTVAAIRTNYVQTNTINPGQEYRGILLSDLPKSGGYPEAITFTVRWIDQDHQFQFSVQPETVAPLPTTSTVATATPVPAAPTLTSAPAPKPYSQTSTPMQQTPTAAGQTTYRVQPTSASPASPPQQIPANGPKCTAYSYQEYQQQRRICDAEMNARQ